MESAIGRGLFGRGDRENPWAVNSALFASMFDDHTIAWLNKRGYLTWDQRGRAEAIIAAVNALIGRQLNTPILKLGLPMSGLSAPLDFRCWE